MIDINKNYNESNLETMAKMPDCFVDLTVTSPPYDNLRDYKGYSFPFEDIAKELFRITKEGGVVVWVIGDETSKFSESTSSFKQALFFNQIGFNLLDTMIYLKSGYAPAYPTLRRYANQFEYMFVFSKGKPKTFNPIMIDKTELTKQRQVNSMPSTFRQKDGTTKKKNTTNTNEKKQASNVWRIITGTNGHTDKFAFKHPATFPQQLASDHILSWSNKGDLVYDPFMGSGTTAKMSILNNRNWIGSEISNEYCNIIEERIKKAWEEKRKEKDLQAGTLFENEM
jgi:site-specific DNA-methyltransferase (adenine-specific)